VILRPMPERGHFEVSDTDWGSGQNWPVSKIEMVGQNKHLST
jgi:hypothetical protein